MAIYLFIPEEPFMSTLEEKKAYLNMQRKASEAYCTYGDLMGMFSIFSIKKNRAHKQAMNDFVKSREDFYRLVKKTNITRFHKEKA